MNEWAASELNVLRDVYPKQGAAGVRALLPHKTAAAIRAQAARLGLRSERQEWGTEKPWALPAHDLTEQLACIRLRNWRGPVMAGPLVGVIGRAYG